MTAHTFVPRSLAFDDPPDTPTSHRCVGCGLVRRDPSPRLDDDCHAAELFEGDDA